jgi:RimJ/RimL family protein N-acetyltransferase
VGVSGHPAWPLLDLVLTNGELELRPVAEATAFALAELLPPDLELDPAAVTYPLPDPRDARGAVALQSHWRAHGNWRPEAWRIDFAVRRRGELVGLQELEAEDFPRLRTVDSASWLVQEHRGQGVGVAMRLAVLALAFGPLEAQAAITSAWRDNEASLGVSRSLGYRPNGEQLHARGEGVDTMVHLRLTRTDWLAGTGSGDVARGVGITNFDTCRPLFGL